jgi:uncharacterized protein (TIGR00369 family)
MSPTPPQLALTLEQLRTFLRAEFPQVWTDGSFEVEAVGHLTSRVRLNFHDRHLRPGGTISGPAMFTLADLALYVAILAQLGPVGHAVTTHLNINFLHRPPPRDLIGEARLFKLGKRLAVGDVAIFSAGGAEMVAHATGGYSIPPRRAAHEVS